VAMDVLVFFRKLSMYNGKVLSTFENINIMIEQCGTLPNLVGMYTTY
jgi:hypothetical protein